MIYSLQNEINYPKKIIKIDVGQFLLIHKKLIISDILNSLIDASSLRLLGSTKNFPIVNICMLGYVSFGRSLVDRNDSYKSSVVHLRNDE